MLADRSLPGHRSPSKRFFVEDNVFEEAACSSPSQAGPTPGIILTVEGDELQPAEVIAVCTGEQKHYHHHQQQQHPGNRSSRRSMYHQQQQQQQQSYTQRSPSATRMRRNASNQKLRDSSLTNFGSGVSRSQSMRTARRPQSVDPNSRFRHRISSIPNDMLLPTDLLDPQRVASNQSLPLPSGEDDTDVLRLRNFAVTPKGVVNRGDSFRSKSRSTHSVSSMSSGMHTPIHRLASDDSSRVVFVDEYVASAALEDLARIRSKTPEPILEGAVGPVGPEKKKYRVLVLGPPDVGKTSLTRQFMTSEYICSYEGSIDEDNEKCVSVVLNNEESELVFLEHTFMDDAATDLSSMYSPDAYLVVYSVTNKRSLQICRNLLRLIHKWDCRIDTKALILVGNKMDLARLRVLSVDDGRCLAMEEGCKFIETSAGINHHVDELLVGLLTQIRLKLTSADKLLRKRESISLGPSGKGKTSGGKCASGCAGCRAKGLLKRILKKACNKSKSCDNLHVL